MKTTCKDCQHFSALNTQCRRHPPVPIAVGLDQNGSPLVSGMFPTVLPTDWCGDASVIPQPQPEELVS